MDVKWLPVSEFPTYEVSEEGEVRRLVAARGTRVGRLVRRRKINSGYWIVLLQKDGRTFGRLVHRIVAGAFIGPCPDGHEVNHKDFDKGNCQASNLEYLTRSENLLHRAALGIGVGENNGSAKLTAAQVKTIRTDYRFGGGPGYIALAKQYGVSSATIYQVIKGSTWKSVIA